MARKSSWQPLEGRLHGVLKMPRRNRGVVYGIFSKHQRDGSYLVVVAVSVPEDGLRLRQLGSSLRAKCWILAECGRV